MNCLSHKDLREGCTQSHLCFSFLLTINNVRQSTRPSRNTATHGRVMQATRANNDLGPIEINLHTMCVTIDGVKLQSLRRRRRMRMIWKQRKAIAPKDLKSTVRTAESNTAAEAPAPIQWQRRQRHKRLWAMRPVVALLLSTKHSRRLSRASTSASGDDEHPPNVLDAKMCQVFLIQPFFDTGAFSYDTGARAAITSAPRGCNDASSSFNSRYSAWPCDEATAPALVLVVMHMSTQKRVFPAHSGTR